MTVTQCTAETAFSLDFIFVCCAAEMSTRFIRAKFVLSSHWDFHQHLSRKMESSQPDQREHTHTHTYTHSAVIPALSLPPLHLSPSLWFTNRASMLLYVTLISVTMVSEQAFASSLFSFVASSSCPCGVVVVDREEDWVVPGSPSPIMQPAWFTVAAMLTVSCSTWFQEAVDVAGWRKEHE